MDGEGKKRGGNSAGWLVVGRRLGRGLLFVATRRYGNQRILAH